METLLPALLQVALYIILPAVITRVLGVDHRRRLRPRSLLSLSLQPHAG